MGLQGLIYLRYCKDWFSCATARTGFLALLQGLVFLRYCKDWLSCAIARTCFFAIFIIGSSGDFLRHSEYMHTLESCPIAGSAAKRSMDTFSMTPRTHCAHA